MPNDATPPSGSRKLHSFAPSWGDPDLLEKTLVGRRDLVDRLEELVIDGASGPNKHQQLIVGVRGSGKTHVMRVLHNRLWRNDELKQHLLIVYLLEDELGIASYLDFVVHMLQAIRRWYPEYDARLGGDLDRLYDLPADLQESRAIQLLLGVIGQRNVLVLVENLGIIFDKKLGFGRQGQQTLRDLVQQHPRFMLFASSQALIEGVREQAAPFFAFFRITHLPRLSVGEAISFLQAIATAYGKHHIVSFLGTPAGRGKTEAIYEFTGGNHRLLVTFYEFLATDFVARLSDQFLESLNELKPYYQEQMRALSAQQQKIVQFLSLAREPQSVKEIARNCLVAANTVSSQLQELRDRNFVSKIERGRESYYEITEPLFRICYEADLEQAGAPVRLFVDFLGHFYTAKELQFRRRGFLMLAEEAHDRAAIPFAEEATFYARAIEIHHPGAVAELQTPDQVPVPLLGRAKAFFDDLKRARAYREILEFSRHLDEDKPFVHDAKAAAYAGLGDTESAEQEALSALHLDPDDADAHVVLAQVYFARPDKQELALTHVQRGAELAPGSLWPLLFKALLLTKSGDFSAALTALGAVTLQHPRFAGGWRLLGLVLADLGRGAEAEQAYRRALELDPGSAETIHMLGVVLQIAGRSAEALAQFETLTRMRPEEPAGWQGLGRALSALDRTAEAEQAYRKALELGPDDAETVAMLGLMLAKAGKVAEALAQLETLTRVRPEYPAGWALLGHALANLGRKADAERAYRRTLELDPDDGDTMEWLGRLVGDAGRHAEALAQFETLTRMRPGYAAGWWGLGQALTHLDSYAEAEHAYRRALELDPDDPDATDGLGTVLGKMERHGEALAQFEALTRMRPESAAAWTYLGVTLAQLHRMAEAEQAWRTALDLDPTDALMRAGLGAILLAQGRYTDSLVQFEAACETRAEDADVWSFRGAALHGLRRYSEAAEAYERALQLNSDSRTAWSGLTAALQYLGREEESAHAFEEAVRLGAEPAYLLNTRGEALRHRGDFRRAIQDYEESLRVNPAGMAPRFDLVSALLAQGRTEDAVARFRDAIGAVGDDATGASEGLATQSLHENLMALFEHANPADLSRCLESMFAVVDEAGLRSIFEQALSLTVFELLRQHEQFSEERYSAIVVALESALGQKISVAVAVRLLQVGIAHFKRGDSRALLHLTREERNVFCKELGITESFDG